MLTKNMILGLGTSLGQNFDFRFVTKEGLDFLVNRRDFYKVEELADHAFFLFIEMRIL